MKIGCDPEFHPVMDPYGFVRSGDFSCSRQTRDGHIGEDHGGYVGELRPNPGSPKQVVVRLKRMIKWLAKDRKVIDIIAGGGHATGASTGGHIHFDFPLMRRNDIWFRNEDVDDEISLGDLSRQDQAFIKALDRYIGIPLSKKNGGRRDDSCYGKPSDIRLCMHGKVQGFEYRTPPSWLTSPELAEGVLWTALSIAEIHNDNREIWRNTSLPKKLRPRDFGALLDRVPARGKEYIRIYMGLLFDRKFMLNKHGAIELWTGKRPLDLMEL